MAPTELLTIGSRTDFFYSTVHRYIVDKGPSILEDKGLE